MDNGNPWCFESSSGSPVCNPLPLVDFDALVCNPQVFGLAANSPQGLLFLQQQFVPVVQQILNVPNNFPYRLSCQQSHDNVTAFISSYIQNRLFKTFASAAALDAYTQADVYASGAAPALLLALTLQRDGNLSDASRSPRDWEYTVRANGTTLIDMASATDDLQQGFAYSWPDDLQTQYSRSAPPGFFTFVFERVLLNTLGVLSNPSDIYSTIMEPFPSPSYLSADLPSTMQFSFGNILILSVMWPFSRLVRNLVEEKETRTKEALRMIGVSGGLFWLSWIVAYLIMMLPVCIIFALVAGATFLPASSGFLVFVMFFLFIVNVLLLAMICSTFFNRAKNAGILSPFILIITYFPYFAVYLASSPGWAKYLTSLLPTVGLQIVANSFFQFEAAGMGVTLSTASALWQNVTVTGMLLVLLADCFLYAALAYWLEKVMPTEFGTSESFFCCCTKRIPGVPGVVVDADVADGTDLLHEPLVDAEKTEDNPYIEPVPAAIANRPGIKLKGLTKTFENDQGVPFRAVDRVSMNLHEGQIFVLLGHNGAGKTTTLNMLTGTTPLFLAYMPRPHPELNTEY